MNQSRFGKVYKEGIRITPNTSLDFGRRFYPYDGKDKPYDDVSKIQIIIHSDN